MFDNLSKFLAKQYSQDFASWLIGEPIKLTELQPTELSLEPIRADSVILLKSRRVIAHCEFQTDPDPGMGFRMADYALRIYRQFPDRSLVQVVVYLRETSSEAVRVTTFQGNNFSHEFRVIRLWEQPTAPFLERPGLLPYAALTQTNDRPSVLREVARKIDAMGDRQQQSDLSAISAVIGGLSLDRDVVQKILRRESCKNP
jgi:predicted transposase/invertase (TIGR01784 family)